MDHSPQDPQRRAALAALGAVPLALQLPTPAQAAAIRTDVITVLYRPATTGAPTRLDPAVQAAILALEEEFLQRGFRVLQPKPEVYAVLDKGPGVVVTFADDAGFSAVFSAYRNLRPTPGQDAGIAEVRLQMRVFVGRHTLVAHEGRGQMATRLDPASREFGERRAMELAAKRAAADVAEKTASKLKDLSAAQIEELIRSQPTPSTVVAEVPLPIVATVAAAAPPAPAAPAPAPMAAATPAPAPSAAPTAVVDASKPLAPPRARYALLVGVSNYPGLKGPASQQAELPGVKKDLQNMERTLQGMGWDKRAMRTLLDDKASGAMVRGYLKNLQSVVQKDDLVLVFISGHGAPKEYSLSGFGRPVLADDTGEDDPSTLDFWELQSLVRNLACDRVVLVIDTCHAGGAASKLVTVEVTPNGVVAAPAGAGPNGNAMARQGDQGKHVAIITASRSDEVSGDTANGGLFTLAFLEGLTNTRGAQPLGKVMAEQVVPPVVKVSRERCQREGSKCKWPQQTPEIHFTGRGDQILL
jgi:hypothetical protein